VLVLIFFWYQPKWLAGKNISERVKWDIKPQLSQSSTLTYCECWLKVAIINDSNVMLMLLCNLAAWVCAGVTEDAWQCSSPASSWHLYIAGEGFVCREDSSTGCRWHQWAVQEDSSSAHETDWGLVESMIWQWMSLSNPQLTVWNVYCKPNQVYSQQLYSVAETVMQIYATHWLELCIVSAH